MDLSHSKPSLLSGFVFSLSLSFQRLGNLVESSLEKPSEMENKAKTNNNKTQTTKN